MIWPKSRLTSNTKSTHLTQLRNAGDTCIWRANQRKTEVKLRPVYSILYQFNQLFTKSDLSLCLGLNSASIFLRIRLSCLILAVGLSLLLFICFSCCVGHSLLFFGVFSVVLSLFVICYCKHALANCAWQCVAIGLCMVVLCARALSLIFASNVYTTAALKMYNPEQPKGILIFNTEKCQSKENQRIEKCRAWKHWTVKWVFEVRRMKESGIVYHAIEKQELSYEW